MQSSHLVLAGHRPLSQSHFPITVYTIRNPWSFATVLKAQKDFMQRPLASLQYLDSTVNVTVFCHTHCLFSWLCFFPIHLSKFMFETMAEAPHVIANNFYLCCQNSFCAKYTFHFFIKWFCIFWLKTKSLMYC